MTAYYNEIDPYAAEWLRNLIAAGHIAPGKVDERNIEDVTPSDLQGFTQCHFFAGIGIWSFALRLAGWPDDRPVWTGSCPCQPFSAAGKGEGFDDERHLWPAWFHLIGVCRPSVVFGEQVESKNGRTWFDLVQADLEGSSYAIGAVAAPAAGYSAPHLRHRIEFAAYRLGDTDGSGTEFVAGNNDKTPEVPQGQRQSEISTDVPERSGTGDNGWGFHRSHSLPGPTNGHWRNVDWLGCRDGKWRSVEPGTFPLVDGSASRVGRLCAYGNGIVAQKTAEFIRATKGLLP